MTKKERFISAGILVAATCLLGLFAYRAHKSYVDVSVSDSDAKTIVTDEDTDTIGVEEDLHYYNSRSLYTPSVYCLAKGANNSIKYNRYTYIDYSDGSGEKTVVTLCKGDEGYSIAIKLGENDEVVQVAADQKTILYDKLGLMFDDAATIVTAAERQDVWVMIEPLAE